RHKGPEVDQGDGADQLVEAGGASVPSGAGHAAVAHGVHVFASQREGAAEGNSVSSFTSLCSLASRQWWITWNRSSNSRRGSGGRLRRFDRSNDPRTPARRQEANDCRRIPTRTPAERGGPLRAGNRVMANLRCNSPVRPVSLQPGT